ncbi:hypothetical protein [Streptomyces sp. or20]|uniref:hypothetical protein n=1 Tax=Streptomyces sp. or20 TaxID=1828016 RepID=UPI000BF1D418|nr:hypothetical protein [Streptomyces sp. or20]
MGPDILVAVIAAASALGVAMVTALPTLLAVLRRTQAATQTAVENQGAETRTVTLDALDSVGSRLEARFNARIDDLRDDIDDVRENVTRVREWQAGHDAEHIISRPRTGGDAT